MAHALERALRKLTRLDEDVRRLAQDVNALRDEPARFAAPDPSAVRSWLLADEPEQAVLDLVELGGWVSAVYLRYPDAAQ